MADAQDTRTPSLCKAAGCDRPARTKGSPHCEAHYYRLRRNGHLELPERDIPDLIEHSGGYQLKYAPDHPLSRGHSRIGEHRVVYYEAHGTGPFDCYHCGTAVTWDDMHVDHLNDRPDDNRLANLVASCPPCNVKRGAWKMTRSHRAKSRWQVTWQGQTQHVGDWAEQLGVAVHVLKWRLERWPLDRAMTEAVGPTGPKASG